MKIAYINRGKAAKKTETDKILKQFQERDLRLFVVRYKAQIESLNISEVDFIERFRKRVSKTT